MCCFKRHLLCREGHGNSGGFTLIELMVTLAVSVILLTVAVPAYSDLLKNSRLSTQANDFVTSLQLARSEAIKRNNYVTVCKSNDGASCAANGTWDQGWIIFVDADSDAAVDAGEDILRVQAVLGGDTFFSAQANLDDYISYQSLGFAQLTDGTIQVGRLILCDDRGFINNVRAIDLSGTGRPRIADPAEYGLVSCVL
ncbi:GspH/FimT family pseudopilin [Pseudomonadota bacterium]